MVLRFPVAKIKWNIMSDQPLKMRDAFVAVHPDLFLVGLGRICDEVVVHLVRGVTELIGELGASAAS